MLRNILWNVYIYEMFYTQSFQEISFFLKQSTKQT